MANHGQSAGWDLSPDGMKWAERIVDAGTTGFPMNPRDRDEGRALAEFRMAFRVWYESGEDPEYRLEIASIFDEAHRLVFEAASNIARKAPRDELFELYRHVFPLIGDGVLSRSFLVVEPWPLPLVAFAHALASVDPLGDMSRFALAWWTAQAVGAVVRGELPTDEASFGSFRLLLGENFESDRKAVYDGLRLMRSRFDLPDEESEEVLGDYVLKELESWKEKDVIDLMEAMAGGKPFSSTGYWRDLCNRVDRDRNRARLESEVPKPKKNDDLAHWEVGATLDQASEALDALLGSHAAEIMKARYRNPKMSVRGIAKEVGVSTSTVERRQRKAQQHEDRVRSIVGLDWPSD